MPEPFFAPLRTSLVLLGLILIQACSPPVAETGAAVEAQLTADEQQQFIEGNLTFIALHEAGHALVSEFAIPVLGREEDAVDRLAAWLMTPATRDDDAAPLVAAMTGWFLMADETGVEELAWWDAHGTDAQRAYQIACLLYGTDPAVHGAVAEMASLPEERRDECEAEAVQNEDSWLKLMEPHRRTDGEVGPPDAVRIAYQPSQAFAKEQQLLSSMALLEEIATLLRDDFRITPGILVKAEQCGNPNAFWDPDNRRVTICYELVRDISNRAKAARSD